MAKEIDFQYFTQKISNTPLRANLAVLPILLVLRRLLAPVRLLLMTVSHTFNQI